MSEPRVLIYAGHSGGHLFPALAFAESFRKRFPKSRLILVSSRKAETFVKTMPEGIFDEFLLMEEFPFPAGISLRSIFFLIKFAQAFAHSSGHLSKIKPDLCVGFGSYVSYPGMKLASMKKIPTLIHEQNLLPGKATQMLARHMDKVAVSFESTFLNAGLKSREVTGLPIRSVLINAAAPKKASPQKNIFHILVVGGSQGAHQLNEAVLQTFSRLSSLELKKIAVTHIAGQKDFDWVLQTYQKIGVTNRVFPFYQNMQELYREADMAITRAGANTLFELALFGIPAILVPYPHADSHQAASADYFTDRKAAICIREEFLTADNLLEKIQAFQSNEGLRHDFSTRISEMATPGAPEALADMAEQLLASREVFSESGPATCP